MGVYEQCSNNIKEHGRHNKTHVYHRGDERQENQPSFVAFFFRQPLRHCVAVGVLIVGLAKVCMQLGSGLGARVARPVECGCRSWKVQWICLKGGRTAKAFGRTHSSAFHHGLTTPLLQSAKLFSSGDLVFCERRWT